MRIAFSVTFALLIGGLAEAQPPAPGGFTNPATETLDMDTFGIISSGSLEFTPGGFGDCFLVLNPDGPGTLQSTGGSPAIGFNANDQCSSASFAGFVMLSGSRPLVISNVLGNFDIELQPNLETVLRVSSDTLDSLVEVVADSSQTGVSLEAKDSSEVVVLFFNPETPQLSVSGNIISDTVSKNCQSAAPSSGSKGDEYCDSDLTVPCWHNGTSFVQMDDFSTVCS